MEVSQGRQEGRETLGGLERTGWAEGGEGLVREGLGRAREEQPGTTIGALAVPRGLRTKRQGTAPLVVCKGNPRQQAGVCHSARPTRPAPPAEGDHGSQTSIIGITITATATLLEEAASGRHEIGPRQLEKCGKFRPVQMSSDEMR